MEEELIERALQVRKNAYAPYSGFRVGAALLCADGSVYTGCNVESAAYAACCCAERTAVSKAVSEGRRSFLAIAIVGGKEQVKDYCFPCGVCRQVLREFCPDTLQVIAAISCEDYRVTTLGALLPESFSAADLQ